MSQTHVSAQKLKLPNVLEMKKKLEKDYEKQMVKLKQLQQAEQKNVHLAKCYDLAVTKMKWGQDIKKKLNDMKLESDLQQELEMKRKKDLIADIKKKEQQFLQQKHEAQQEELKMRSTFIKEYKNKMQISNVMIKSTIVEENKRNHDNILEAEREQIRMKKERIASLSLGQQNQEEKINRELRLAQEYSNKLKELEINEKKIMHRLKETQKMLSHSQKKFNEIHSNPQSKRKKFRDSTSIY